MQLDPDPDPDPLASPVSLQSAATTGLLSSPPTQIRSRRRRHQRQRQRRSFVVTRGRRRRRINLNHIWHRPAYDSIGLIWHREAICSGWIWHRQACYFLRLDLASIWNHITCLIFPAPDFFTASIWPPSEHLPTARTESILQ